MNKEERDEREMWRRMMARAKVLSESGLFGDIPWEEVLRIGMIWGTLGLYGFGPAIEREALASITPEGEHERYKAAHERHRAAHENTSGAARGSGDGAGATVPVNETNAESGAEATPTEELAKLQGYEPPTVAEVGRIRNEQKKRTGTKPHKKTVRERLAREWLDDLEEPEEKAGVVYDGCADDDDIGDIPF